MIKQILLILSIIICTSCSTISSSKPYNTPFINTDDTIQLQQGMSKASVLEKIGYPLYVKSGINNTCGNRLWRVDTGGSGAFDEFDSVLCTTDEKMENRKPQVLEILDDNKFNILKYED